MPIPWFIAYEICRSPRPIQRIRGCERVGPIRRGAVQQRQHLEVDEGLREDAAHRGIEVLADVRDGQQYGDSGHRS
jgi:hypothetical protein